MNAVFADTSGLFALVNTLDHEPPSRCPCVATVCARVRRLLVSTSFVLVETYALLGRRLGLDAVRSFRGRLRRARDRLWVDEALHDAGLDLLRRPTIKRLLRMRRTRRSDVPLRRSHAEHRQLPTCGFRPCETQASGASRSAVALASAAANHVSDDTHCDTSSPARINRVHGRRGRSNASSRSAGRRTPIRRLSSPIEDGVVIGRALPSVDEPTAGAR